MIATIILLLVLIVVLLPSTNITIDNKFFNYEFCANLFYLRIRQLFNYMRFHFRKISLNELNRFREGSYICIWQYERLMKWHKLHK